MTSILLSRHGPVALSPPRFPTKNEFRNYVNVYERSGVCANASPPKDLAERVRNAVTVFTGPSLRAQNSLKLLDPERVPITDAVFSEEAQIIPELAGRWPLIVWFSLTRGVGAFHPREAGSRRAMRQRADKAANLLLAAAERGPVALIGHGWFNRAIAQALSCNRWRRAEACRGSGSFGRVSSTWGYVVFEEVRRAERTRRIAADEQ